jgi:hypothetical protein
MAHNPECTWWRARADLGRHFASHFPPNVFSEPVSEFLSYLSNLKHTRCSTLHQILYTARTPFRATVMEGDGDKERRVAQRIRKRPCTRTERTHSIEQLDSGSGMRSDRWNSRMEARPPHPQASTSSIPSTSYDAEIDPSNSLSQAVHPQGW